MALFSTNKQQISKFSGFLVIMLLLLFLTAFWSCFPLYPSSISKRPYYERTRFKWRVTSSFSQENATIEMFKTYNGFQVSIELDTVCNLTKPYVYFREPKISMLRDHGIGPDEIMVQLEGASLQTNIALLSDHLNCSKYSTTFQIPIYGKYRLKIFRLRQDYTAVKELDKHPHMNYDEFLDQSLPGEFRYYAPVPCQDLVQGYWVTSEDRLQYRPIEISQKCVGNNGTEKRGLNITTHVILEEPIKINKCANDIDYRWSRGIANDLSDL